MPEKRNSRMDPWRVLGMCAVYLITQRVSYYSGHTCYTALTMWSRGHPTRDPFDGAGSRCSLKEVVR